MKIVFLIALMFFAIVGISHIVFEIYYNVTKIKDENACTLIIDKINSSIDVEFAIRSIIAKTRKSNDINIDTIVCFNDGLDDKTNKMLKLLQKDYDCLIVQSKEEFIEKLECSS